MPTAKILIAGSRSITDKAFVFKMIQDEVDKLFDTYDISFVSGGALGVDSIAEQFANEKGALIEVVKANWDKHGKSAGYIRNSEMLSNYGVTHVIAISDGSRGTAHTIGLAERKRIPMKHVFVHGNLYRVTYTDCHEDTFTRKEIQMELPL